MQHLLETFWRNKSLVITGASSGLGAAITEMLASYSVDFCLLSRRLENMQALADKLQDSGSTFFLQACDVRKREQVYEAIHAFHEKVKRIDVVWVNSGISMDSSIENWTWESFEKLVDTNIKGAIYTAQAGLEIMKKQGHGALVGIGSAASMRGLPRRGIYSMTKVAMEYYMQSVAVESPEIDVTMIHPGFVDTPINKGNPMRFWLLKPEKAARIMVTAVARRKRYLIYPFRMGLLYRFVRALPVRVFDFLGRKLINFSPPPKKTHGV